LRFYGLATGLDKPLGVAAKDVIHPGFAVIRFCRLDLRDGDAPSRRRKACKSE